MYFCSKADGIRNKEKNIKSTKNGSLIINYPVQKGGTNTPHCSTKRIWYSMCQTGVWRWFTAKPFVGNSR